MGTRLYVAAGGGGDAIAAAMLHRATRRGEAPAHIATYSWDRLLIDPIPGPRDPSWFEGLEPVGERNYLVKPTTSVRPPAGSTLPRLAGELPDVRLYLLDPRGGARGIHEQLAELTRVLPADRVVVVDVGGDILARGDEPTLRSPLADALVLAATTELPVAVDVVVMGPGLDGELPQAQVLELCRAAAKEIVRFSPSQVAEFGRLFEWHPSEATGLLWAAVMGAHGRAELRDGPCIVDLGDESSHNYILDREPVFLMNRAAQVLGGCDSLAGAETKLQKLGAPSEVAYERRKADCSGSPATEEVAEEQALSSRLKGITEGAAAREIDFLTIRRLAELVAGRERPADWLITIQGLRDSRYRPPVWVVRLSAWPRS